MLILLEYSLTLIFMMIFFQENFKICILVALIWLNAVILFTFGTIDWHMKFHW
jgi:hypothetical protein